MRCHQSQIKISRLFAELVAKYAVNGLRWGRRWREGEPAKLHKEVLGNLTGTGSRGRGEGL